MKIDSVSGGFALIINSICLSTPYLTPLLYFVCNTLTFQPVSMAKSGGTRATNYKRGDLNSVDSLINLGKKIFSQTESAVMVCSATCQSS